MPTRYRLSWRLGFIGGLLILARVLLGFVFLMASIPKLEYSFAFLSTVYSFELLGRDAGLLVAAYIPFLELITGSILLLGIGLEGAAFVSAGLLSVFSLVQAWVLLKGWEMPCGCFNLLSSDGDMIGFLTLARTCFLLLTAGFLILGLYVRSRAAALRADR